MDDAFVRLARRFFSSDLWKEPRELSRAEAWLDMIATAAFAAESRLIEGRCLNLQRGELATSQRYLAARWAWSRSKVERFLDNLTAAGRIRTRNEPGTSIITLCNYERYNPHRARGEPPNGPAPSHPRAKVKEGLEAPSGHKNFEEAINRLGNRAGSENATEAMENEFMLKCIRVLGKSEMNENGGGWRTYYRQNPDKAERVIAEVETAIRERPKTIRKSLGAFAMDLWKRFK